MPNKAKLESLENQLISRAKQSNRQSYVEFLANQTLIQSYLDKGYNIFTVWQALFDEGIISFEYSTFTRHLRKYRAADKKLPTKDEPNQTAAESSQPSETNTPQIIIQENQPKAAIKLNLPDGMSHNPMINPKDLI